MSHAGDPAPISDPAPTPPPSPTPPPVPPTPAPSNGRSLADVERDLAEVRAEAAARRISARDAEERARTLAAEIEQLQTSVPQQIAQARAEERTRMESLKPKIVDAELKAHLTAAGVLDPDLVGLISRDGITVDDAGNVTGVAEAVAKFKETKPQFFRDLSAAPPAPSPAPVPRSTSGNPGSPPANPEPRPTDVKGMDAGAYRDWKSQMRRRVRGSR